MKKLKFDFLFNYDRKTDYLIDNASIHLYCGTVIEKNKLENKVPTKKKNGKALEITFEKCACYLLSLVYPLEDDEADY